MKEIDRLDEAEDYLALAEDLLSQSVHPEMVGLASELASRRREVLELLKKEREIGEEKCWSC